MQNSKDIPRGEQDFIPFEDIFKTVKSCGPYQKRLVYGSNIFLVMVMGFQFYILIFGYGTVPFRCATPNVSCPLSQCCSNCTAYEFLGPLHTFISEYNLICERAYLAATIQSCFYGGTIIGGLTAGIMSDVFGRRVTMYVFNFILVASAIGSSFANSVPLMAVLRFLNGLGTIGLNTAHYVYFLEHVGTSSRTLAATIHSALWGVHSLLLGLIAYFVRDWRYLALVVGVPGLALYFFCRVIPRSPRWLLARDHLDEAHSVIMKYGAKKGKTLDPVALRDLLEKIRKGELEKMRKEQKRISVIDLLKSTRLRKRVLIMFFVMIGQVFLGNAFFLYINHLSGNIYVNYALFNIIPQPLVLLSGVLLKKCGRRFTCSGIFATTGVLCLCGLAVPEEHNLIRSGLFITANAIINMNWNSIFIFMSELFPTIVRTTSVGMVVTIGRFGGLLAPYMGYLGQIAGLYFTLPLIVFGATSVSLALLTLCLPDTVFANMHQTIEEAEADKEYYGMPCCYKPDVTQDDGDGINKIACGDLDCSVVAPNGSVETRM